MYADVVGLDPSTANDITSEIDSYNEALKQASDEDKPFIKISDYITNPDHRRIFEESQPYQGIIEQAKVHACGFLLFNGNPRQKNVVGYGDIRYEIGLIRCRSESTGKSTIVANVEGGMLDHYGYVKDDFLIVDVVSLIYELYHAVGREVPTVSELRKMVTGDQPTWNLYANGITCCLNQVEKTSTTAKVKTYKPKNIEELAAFIAAIRPGFKSLIDTFLDRKPYTTGEKKIDHLLEDSAHYMIYQESIMKVLGFLGLPMGETYGVIKSISKKKLKGEKKEELLAKIRTTWNEKFGNLDNFDAVWNIISDASRYSFNCAHALAMAFDSLYEAWMKAHYPSVFYETAMNHYQKKNDKKKVAELAAEATGKLGYQMGTFEFGQNNSQFTVDNKTKMIYPTLASIKGIGQKAASDMYKISQEKYGDFIDVYRATCKTKVNRNVFCNLIKINYFRKFGPAKKLMKIVDLVDNWRGTNWDGRKTISKTDVTPDLNEVIRKYATDVLPSGKVSAKQYTIKDWVGLVRELISRIPDEDYSFSEMVKFKVDILGYVDYKNDEFDKHLVVVTDLDMKYSPKFQAYCLKTGQVEQIKIYKTPNKKAHVCYADVPVQNGDVICMKTCKKMKKWKYVHEKPTVVPNEFEWWLTDYQIVNL